MLYSQVGHTGLAHGRADRLDRRLDAGQQLRQVPGGRRHLLLLGQHEPRQRHAVRVERRRFVLVFLRHLGGARTAGEEPAQNKRHVLNGGAAITVADNHDDVVPTVVLLCPVAGPELPPSHDPTRSRRFGPIDELLLFFLVLFTNYHFYQV